MIGDRFRRVAIAASAVAIVMGTSGLLGWLLDVDILKSALPGGVTMKANAAGLLVSSGVSLWLQVKASSASRDRWAAKAFALLTITVAALTLTEYLFGIDLGIDQFLSHAAAGEVYTLAPGRMAPNTALGFALVGAALAFLDSPVRAIRLLSEMCASAVLVMAFVVVSGYLINFTALYGVGPYTSMALPSAVGLSALSIGVLVSRPNRGVLATLTQDSPAGAASGSTCCSLWGHPWSSVGYG